MSEPAHDPAAPPSVDSPATAAADEDLLVVLADDFAARLRRGQQPQLEEYAERHPPLADRIRKMLQAVALMVQSRTVDYSAGAERVGDIIGRYKLLERIGEGGFGVVYMAEQQHPVRRKAALKVVKPGMDTRQVLARFEAERQALAIMDHPNIAKVFDAGATDSGRPYFVMELVRGEPITEFCDRNRLTPQERLALLAQACHAVQHAHTKGIIHRDIKPTNVLVAMHDARPVVKVIDFGVAKALGQELTDKTLFTGFAQLLGTPLYMSPEQAGQSSLDIDTRSDVYSLGVLLYELLTGATPFDKERFKQAAHDEICRIIREEEPPRPSTRLSESKDSLPSISAQRHTEPAKLTKLVRGELDWIVMKALEKDRTRRYETATGLARDIERYLNDEQVEACPPSAAYRFRKFARRNKAALTVASLALLSLLLLGAGVGWVIGDRSARRARVAGQVELILNEVDELQNQHKWPEALAAARRAEAAVTGGDADLQTAGHVRAVLKDLRFVDRLEQIRVLQATPVGLIFDYPAADRAYALAFREYGVDVDKLPVETSIARFNARPAIGVAVASGLDCWVAERKRLDEERDWKRLVTIANGIDPEPLRARIRDAWGQPVAAAPDDLRQLAESIDIPAQRPPTINQLAQTLLRAKQTDAALRLLRDAQSAFPGDFWLNLNLAEALFDQKNYEGAVRFYTAAISIRPNEVAPRNGLGVALRFQRKLDEAIVAYRGAIDRNPEYYLAHSNLGALLLEQGKLDDAIAASRRAIELDSNHALTYSILGNALRGKGKLDEAIAAHRKAIELEPTTALHHLNLGVPLADQGKLDEAIAAWRKAIELEPKHATAYRNLGGVLHQQKKLDEAVAAYRRAIELDAKNIEVFINLGALLCDDLKDYAGAVENFRKAIELDPKNVLAYNNLGNALSRQMRWEEAIAAYRKSIKLDPKFVPAYESLGNALRRQGKVDEAIAAYRTAIDLDPKSAYSYNRLAWLLATCSDLKFHDPGLALTYFKKALEISPDNPVYLNNLGVAHYRSGDSRAAIAALQRSMELQKPGYTDGWFFLAMSHWQLGNKDEARRWFDKAAQRMAEYDSANEELIRFRAEAAELLGVDDKAERAALEAARQLNQRAWALATNADPAQRDPEQAVALAEKAVAELPKDPDCFNTLGVARYYAGDFKGAVTALEKYRELRRGDAEWTNPFFLAMAHWRLGNQGEARTWYDKAVAWMDAAPGRSTGIMKRFRAEAAELFHANEKTDSNPSSAPKG